MEPYKNLAELSRVQEAKSLKKSIILHKNKGFTLHNPQPTPRKNNNNPGKRGTINDFTRHSRNRMRSFLINNNLPDDWEVFGITLTIPGYPLPVDKIKSLFHRFATVNVRRLPFNFAAVWRIEIQKRGSVHWHLIAGADTKDKELIIEQIKNCWLKSLKAVGTIPLEHLGSFSQPNFLGAEKLNTTFDYWKEINEHYKDSISTGYTNKGEVYPVEKKSILFDKACDVAIFEKQEYGNWLRYIHDHTTKSKQEQIAAGFGKHWGYINKAAFVHHSGDSIELDDKQYYIICRWFQRLCTPVLTDKTKSNKWLFNRKKGKNWRRRGKAGNSHFFSNPETMRKMINYVLENYPEQ
jgi:hypothetical protein